MCRTAIPRASSASAMSWRWQRHGTASAHMTTTGCAPASAINRATACSQAGRRIIGSVYRIPHKEDAMTEKEQFLGALQKELPTTMRVLKAYPAAKGDLKPHAKCKSARELAWMFVTEQKASEQALDGGIEFGKMPKAPGTLGEVISTYEQSSKAFVERIKQTP